MMAPDWRSRTTQGSMWPASRPRKAVATYASASAGCGTTVNHSSQSAPSAAASRSAATCSSRIGSSRTDPLSRTTGAGVFIRISPRNPDSGIISALIRYQGTDNMVKDPRAGLPRLPLVGEARRGPEGYLTYLLRQANASVRLALDRALSQEDMTHPQQSALTMIRAYEAISAADLARLTMLTPQTVNGIVRALEMRGAIRKQKDPLHGRILRLLITADGRELNKRCRALIAPIEAALKGAMPAGLEGTIRQWLVD